MAKRSSPEQLAAFGRRLRDLREELGLSQQEVADRLEMTDAGYGAFERGQRMPAADQLPWLAAGLGVMTAELLVRLGLVDQKLLDGPVPEELAGRLARIVANYAFLTNDQKSHVDAILGLASNFGRPNSAALRHPDTASDGRHERHYFETDRRLGAKNLHTPRVLALA